MLQLPVDALNTWNMLRQWCWQAQGLAVGGAMEDHRGMDSRSLSPWDVVASQPSATRLEHMDREGPKRQEARADQKLN